MEVYATKKDETGKVLLDGKGRYLRDKLFGLFVMRKEKGFGEMYQENRNGEWEYMAYRPNGDQMLPPERTTACAGCHVEAGQGRDWVFGTHRFFAGGMSPQPKELDENQINVVDYAFLTDTLTVKVGTKVTWVSNDVVFHTVTIGNGSFSRALRPGASVTREFKEAGTYEYFCGVHPAMKGKIVVTE